MNNPLQTPDSETAAGEAVASAQKHEHIGEQKRKRARMIKLALLLAVIAIGLYASSIVWIIHTRGGAA